VEEGPDFLVVAPPRASRLTPDARIDTYDDHRMAMCFALAALGGVTVRINDPGCVAKTYPDYFLHFADVTSGSGVPVIAIDGRPRRRRARAVAQWAITWTAAPLPARHWRRSGPDLATREALTPG
jgi:hypothetical protein